MPTITFQRLPEAKKAKIMAAIRQELTRVRFDKVSINKIVQAAGIPRGSFYQYFADKYDMLSYLMESYYKGMMQLTQEVLESNGGDVFALMPVMLDVSLRFCKTDGNLQMFKNIIASMPVLVDNDHVQFPLQLCPPVQILLHSNCRTDGWKHSSQQDFQAVAEVLFACFRDTLLSCLGAPQQQETYTEAFLRKIDFIKYGVLNCQEGE